MRLAVIAGLSVLLAATAAPADTQKFGQLEHGKYLTTLGDCEACHTAPGGKPFAGGRALETPFGKLVTPNITPDRETGIGAWTADQFVRALHQGINAEGKHLYPAFPYLYFTRVKTADVLAIRTYLDALPPVRNAVQPNKLPFPFDIREGLAGWNELYFKAGRFQPQAGKSPEWNRGAYLVQGLAHCGACHTAKNELGGDETDKALQGGLLQGWYAPNLTGDQRTGLGGWSVEDVITYLKTGHNAVAAATGPMAEVVSYSTSRLNQADLKAIAVYLKDQPGQGGAQGQPIAASDARLGAGKAVYADRCSGCHRSDGAGIAGLIPKLSGAPAIQASSANNLIRVILEGARSVATAGAPTAPAMPAFGWVLNDHQAAAVVTFIRNSWGNAAPAVSADNIAEVRQAVRTNPEQGLH